MGSSGVGRVRATLDGRGGDSAGRVARALLAAALALDVRATFAGMQALSSSRAVASVSGVSRCFCSRRGERLALPGLAVWVGCCMQWMLRDIA